MNIKDKLLEIKKTKKQIHLDSLPELKKEVINNTSFLNSDAENVERIYCILNDIIERPICPTCRNNYLEFSKKTYKYKSYCSIKCQHSNIDKKMKTKKTCIEKYGVDNPMKNNEIKEKSKLNNNYEKMVKSHKNTMMKKYGVDNPMKLQSTKTKIKNTCIEKYGVDNPMKNNEIKSKLSKKILDLSYDQLIKRPGFLDKVTPLFNKELYTGISNHQEYKFKCNKCNNEFYDWVDSSYKFIPRCLICYPIKTSIFESEVYSFIESILDDEILRNDRKLGIELDIFIPKFKLAIECDGLFWHSELNGKDSNYHLNKTEICERHNIRVIHIFEDEWIFKKDIIKSKIKYILKVNNDLNKIYARNCIINEIDSKTSNTFLNKNHIQGKDNSSIKLGLFYNNNLVSVMTFSKIRNIFNIKNKSDFDYELVRFASDIDSIVVGGFSKLLKYFIKNNKVKNIITYADRRYSLGNLYIKNNFQLKNISKPTYYYIKRNNNKAVRFHRYSFAKYKLKEKFPNYYKEELTENEIMTNAGYIRIWDCGQYSFIKSISSEDSII